MIRIAIFLALLTLSLLGTQNESRRLTKDAVTVLVMNTTAFLALESRNGCPSLDVVPEGENLISVQLRNTCPTSGSGLIDNYTVDLRTGEIWTGVDDRKIVDSERLRLLRRVLLQLPPDNSRQGAKANSNNRKQ
jgi:hypothetical protein